MTDYGSTRRKAMMDKFDMDRRKRKLRRMWYNASEELGRFLWLVVTFMIAVGLWMVYVFLPR